MNSHVQTRGRSMLGVLVLLGALRGAAHADTVTAGAGGGAAIGMYPDAEIPGLFVNLDGTVDWHPTPAVALGVEAQAWAINTSWQDVMARLTLSTSSTSVRMYVRGGVGAALLHADPADPSSNRVVGLAYAVSCGLLVAAGNTWDIDIGLRFNRFAAADQDSYGDITRPQITAVSIGLGFDTVVR